MDLRSVSQGYMGSRPVTEIREVYPDAGLQHGVTPSRGRSAYRLTGESQAPLGAWSWLKSTAVKASDGINYYAQALEQKIAQLCEPLQSPQESIALVEGIKIAAAYEGLPSRAAEITKESAPIVSRVFSIGGKILKGSGALLNTISGIGATLGQFSSDYYAGDGSYKKTLQRSLGSVSQIGTAYALGSFAAAGSAALIGTTATAALPVIIGGTAAVAAGYGMGKLIEHLLQ